MQLDAAAALQEHGPLIQLPRPHNQACRFSAPHRALLLGRGGRITGLLPRHGLLRGGRMRACTQGQKLQPDTPGPNMHAQPLIGRRADCSRIHSNETTAIN